MTQERGIRLRLYELGCRVSDFGADLAGHPLAQIIVVVVCASWFLLLGSAATAVLTLILSVLAITLTQMVLNQQKRHDVALHLKIDELIHAMRGARNEIMGIEGKTEAELETLRLIGDEAEDELTERHAKATTGKAA
jgi:low affinity Fe/Cu permease